MSDRRANSGRLPVLRILALGAGMLGAVLVCLAPAPRAASAAQDFGAEYEGYSTDGSSVHVIIGGGVVDVRIDDGHGLNEPVPIECALGALLVAVPLDNGAFRIDQQVDTDVHTDRRQTISIAGFFDMPFFDTVGGVLRVQPGDGQPCPTRTAVWRASRSTGSLAAPRNGLGTVLHTTGTVFRGMTADPLGTVRIDTTDIGDGIEAIAISARDGACSYDRTYHSTRNKFLRYDIGVSLDYNDTSATAPWRVVLVSSSLTARGGAILGGTGSCPSLSVYFVADQDAADPTPTPTATATAIPSPTPSATPQPAPVSPRFSGVFPRSGTAIAVFSGGTNAELVTASGCPVATAVFFTSTPSGQFAAFVAAATVATVNAGWNALFPNGIPANTPIVGRCS